MTQSQHGMRPQVLPSASPLPSVSPIAARASSTRSKRSPSSTLSTVSTSTASTTLTAPSTVPDPPLPASKRNTLNIRADVATLQSQPAARPEQQQQQQQQQLHPLRPRDSSHHVLSLTPTTRSATKDATHNSMPPADTRNRHSQLGASPAKPVVRSPLVAKVAAKPASAHSPPTRPPREDAAAAAAPASTVSYINSGSVRSGSRQTRGGGSFGGSASSAPSITTSANTDRYHDRSSDPSWDGPGRSPARPTLMRNESHSSSRLSLVDSSGDARNDSNKFFYASEAKPPPPPPYPRTASVQPKAATTFFYASEAPPSAKRLSNPSASPANPPSTLGTTQEGKASKFFYANGAPELSSSHSRPPLVAIPSSGSGSSVSTTSRMVPGRPGTSNSASASSYGGPSMQRPESPAKAASAISPQSSRTSSVMLPNSPTRGSMYSPSLIAATVNPSKRRVSVESPPKVAVGHGRTSSVVSTTDALNVTKFIMPTVVHSEHPQAPSKTVLGPAPIITVASGLKAVDNSEDEKDDEDEDDKDDDGASGDDDDDDDDDDESSDNAVDHDDDTGGDEDGSEDYDSDQDSYSASKSSRKKEPLSDYVLSARRERKVQDLEIRNASLEAITKTLERQLRKQTAELRRFRRLVRAGKIPDPSARKNRVTSTPSELSDLSEVESIATTTEGRGWTGDDNDEDDEDDDEDADDSLLSEESSSTASASGSQSGDVSRRKRGDERRLELDLTRHQELLKDSQKINQSLKKCLNWTGELIKEGQKALAYQVKLPDEVQFGYGSRVLSHSDEEDDDTTSHQADETLTQLDSDAESAAEPWTKGPQDRDSGIELPVVDSG